MSPASLVEGSSASYHDLKERKFSMNRKRFGMLSRQKMATARAHSSQSWTFGSNQSNIDYRREGSKRFPRKRAMNEA